MPPSRTAPLHPEFLHRQSFVPPRPLLIGDGGERKIVATISTAAPDAHGTSILPEGMTPIARVLPLLLYHNAERPVGRIDEVRQEPEGIEIEAVIIADDAWDLVRSGQLGGVSIGFRILKVDDWDADPVVISRWELIEVSLVTTPSQPNARIESIRSAAMSDPKIINLPSTVVRQVPATRLAGAPYIRRDFKPGFSLRAIVDHLANDTPLSGIEREVVDEYGERTGGLENRGGVRVPSSVFNRRAIESTPPISPDAFLQNLIDDTSAARRWGTLANRLRLTIVNSTREFIHIPKRTAVNEAEFIAKDGDAPETEMLFDRDTLGPRYVGAGTVIRRSALKFGDPSIDSMSRDDLARALDDLADTRLLWGDGVGPNPRGIFLDVPAPLTIDLAGEELGSPHLFRLKQVLSGVWRLDQISDAFMWSTHHSLIDRLRVTSKKVIDPAATAGEWFTAIMPFDVGEGMLLGIPLAQSGRYPEKTAGAGTYDLNLCYGSMIVVVFWGGVDLYIDTATGARSGTLKLYAFLDLNSVKRDDNTVAVIENALAFPAPAPPSGP
jgi:HK97 family phage prohead protease